ncbi:HTH domain-containing protein [Haloarchaeobius amylolyticus]|uniref:HTH domain-containing protein n=1 Tax=Haloarchaeobius amylolyticus TaxID=1198296 RepID=A0ABD6BB31_9EURY
MTDTQTKSTAPVRIELFIQAHASTAVVESLRELVARARRLEDAIGAAVHVETWTAVRPALEELSDSGPSVSGTVEAFRSWADRHGYDLEPAFDRRETPSIVGLRATEVRVPTACVAVYADGDIQCVAPCADGDRIYTVMDCLTGLEDGITEPFGARDDAPRGSSDSDGPAERYARPEETE